MVLERPYALWLLKKRYIATPIMLDMGTVNAIPLPRFKVLNLSSMGFSTVTPAITVSAPVDKFLSITVKLIWSPMNVALKTYVLPFLSGT